MISALVVSFFFFFFFTSVFKGHALNIPCFKEFLKPRIPQGCLSQISIYHSSKFNLEFDLRQKPNVPSQYNEF